MNKNITKILIIGALVITGQSLFAQETPTVTEQSFKAELNTTYLNKYINRGVFVGDNVIHNNVTVEYNKVYVAFNSYLGTQDKILFDEEWDVSLGVSVPGVLLDNLKVDVGVTGFFYPKGMVQDTQEVYIGIGLPVLGFDVSAYGYYDTDVESTYGVFTLGRAFSLTDSLDWETTVSLRMTDINNGPKYASTQVISALTYTFTDNVGISVGGTYEWSDDSDIFDINELVGYFTLSLAL